MVACVRWLLAVAFALPLAGVSAVRAEPEPPRVRPLFPGIPAVAADCPGVMLLTEPPGWSLGDAAAVVVADHRRSEPERLRLIGALLAQDAAVLELAPGSLCGGEATPEAALFAALRAVRRDAGAGLVVAIGYGSGGEAALSAVSDVAAIAQLGPSSSERYAAAALFEGARAVFAAGPMPVGEQAWPRRSVLLCETLAQALAPAGAGGPGFGQAIARECRAAFAPTGGGQVGPAVAAASPRE